MSAAPLGTSIPRAAAVLLVCLVALSSCRLVGAEKVHHSASPTRMRGQAASPHGRQRLSALRDPHALHNAVAEVLGGGHDVRHGKLLAIHAAMEPMWRSLPANKHGRVDRKTLRYAVHRYLLHSSGLSIVGLEPGQVNSSDAEAVLLIKRMPAYVKTTLEGKAAEQGFSIEDAVAMVATLEQLVSDTSRDLLETVYDAQGVSQREKLSRAELVDLLEVYMLHWMMGDDTEGIQELVQNRTLLEEAFTDWHLIAGFAAGRVRALEHERLQGARRVGPAAAVSAWQPLTPEFSAADAEAVVAGITMSFGRFWETECTNVKDSLLKMDRDGTGRVKLSDFYGAAMDGEWRFSESKEYLRQLGALDESSSWSGPRVIIPNYLQGASNCIVSAPSHYRVCCANECEDLLGELEVALGRPLAPPEEILSHIVNMTTTLDDDGPKLSVTLLQQLRQIAEPHGGKVPLHGRLFAQWLHYVFPRECPFPHKAGDSQALSPLEFGEAYVASDEEMGLHIKAAQESPGAGNSSEVPDGNAEDLEADFMSQWSHEEELLSDYAHLAAPWEAPDTSLLGLLALVGSVGALLCRWKFTQSKRASASFLPTTSYGKSHFV